MPIYCEIKTENHGTLFPKCGSEQIAGRNANKAIGEDFTLVDHYDWQAVAHDARAFENVNFSFSVNVPAHAPSAVSALNVLNSKDAIEKLTLIITDVSSTSFGNSRGDVSKVYTAEKGRLISARLNESKNELGVLHLKFEFENITLDNELTNTTGEIKSSNGGY